MTASRHPEETSLSGSAAADVAVLAERARELARTRDPDTAGDTLVLLGFTVADRSYAVEVGQVREVLARAEVSQLPWAPPTIAGVTNVRGEVVHVADAARLLGVGEAPPGGPVIVLDAAGRLLGLRVDVVDDITAVAAGSLVAPEGDAAGVADDLVLGWTPSAVVLDARALHTDSRLTHRPPEVS